MADNEQMSKKREASDSLERPEAPKRNREQSPISDDSDVSMQDTPTPAARTVGSTSAPSTEAPQAPPTLGLGPYRHGPVDLRIGNNRRAFTAAMLAAMPSEIAVQIVQDAVTVPYILPGDLSLAGSVHHVLSSLPSNLPARYWNEARMAILQRNTVRTSLHTLTPALNNALQLRLHPMYEPEIQHLHLVLERLTFLDGVVTLLPTLITRFRAIKTLTIHHHIMQNQLLLNAMAYRHTAWITSRWARVITFLRGELRQGTIERAVIVVTEHNTYPAFSLSSSWTPHPEEIAEWPHGTHPNPSDHDIAEMSLLDMQDGDGLIVPL
ncbi:hypothetical protein MBLNU230_g5540t1 [Neophaeotheca triangularis]